MRSDRNKNLGRTGGYRLLLGDAYSFNESVVQTIEQVVNTSLTGNPRRLVAVSRR